MSRPAPGVKACLAARTLITVKPGADAKFQVEEIPGCITMPIN